MKLIKASRKAVKEKYKLELGEDVVNHIKENFDLSYIEMNEDISFIKLTDWSLVIVSALLQSQ